MANVSFWPAVGASVPFPNADSPNLSTSGATIDSSLVGEYILGLLRTGRVLTYDPLGGEDSPDIDYFTDALYCTSLTTRAGTEGGETIAVIGYSTVNDGGGGQFYWDATSSATADNVTIFGNGASGRWRRVYSGAINVKWAGCKGDGTTNDATALQRAFDAVADGETIHFPSGTYLTGSRILHQRSIAITGNGTVKRHNNFDGQLIQVIGTSGTGDSFSKSGSTITLTDAGASFPTDVVGRTIIILNATTAGNNGTFTVTERVSSTAIRYTNASGATESFSGTWALYLDFVTVDGVKFDGADTGSPDYSLSTPNHELSIQYAKRVRVTGCRFSNTKETGLRINYSDQVNVAQCKFIDGATSYGDTSSTNTYHSAFHNCTSLTVEFCTFETDITHDPGDRTQSGVLAMAPFAIAVYETEHVNVHGCKSRNAGNIEVYEACREVVVSGNFFDECHLPPIKISNCMRVTVADNIITDSQHWWGYGILVSCYTRMETYGCLRPNQGQITIHNNIIKGQKSNEGPIFVPGVLYSTSVLDARITYQAANPSTFPNSRNFVTKTGSDYFYTDFDGTVSSAITQDYLCARNVNITDNLIDGFATTGIYAIYCDHVRVAGNQLVNCANQDTNTAFTKACIKVLESYTTDVTNNSMKMTTSITPTVAGVSSNIIGVMVQSLATGFRGVTRAKIDSNAMQLNKVTYCVYVEDLKYASIQKNDLTVLTFLNTSSVFIRAAGTSNYGLISNNRYALDDTSTTPSASTEYLNVQAGFLEVQFDDERRGAALSRRIVNGATDYTTPNQVASGYYARGSTIAVTGSQPEIYQICTTAGYHAPAHDPAVTYAKGDMVLSAGEYFTSLQGSNLNHTPPAGSSDVWWQRLGTGAAVFASSIVPRTLTGSATYDPGSLADGDGVTTTVTVTGAALGDFAIASFSNALQGITVTAWVSATDTVSVRFQNESGGTLDLASGTLRVRVFEV